MCQGHRLMHAIPIGQWEMHYYGGLMVPPSHRPNVHTTIAFIMVHPSGTTPYICNDLHSAHHLQSCIHLEASGLMDGC